MELYDTPDHQLHPRKKVIQPLPNQQGSDGSNPAVELIRQKIDNLFGDDPNHQPLSNAQKVEKSIVHEPSAKAELIELKTASKHRSKHQKYMQELSESGKSLEDIQTAWHHYYLGLTDREKHEVWQEFYANRPKETEKVIHSHTLPSSTSDNSDTAVIQPAFTKQSDKQFKSESRSVADIKSQLVGKVQSRSQAKHKSHAKSLLFGLGMGTIAVMILLFGFFNERIIAPFITPSKHVSNTPIIIDPSSTSVGPEPKIIIPKINVEIPVVYDEPSIAEAAVQRALEDGVVHYATTPDPGQTGNAVIFGHSSNNILNKGKYKFAFVLLNRMENGDTFMVQKDGKAFVYKVYEKKIVKPSDLSVLGKTGKPSTMTLITCDPPGTSINRLIVIGEQVSPDPNANVASTQQQTTQSPPTELPSNSPTLWNRITSWISG